MNINVLLFQNFTALDVFGPVEVLSSIEGYVIRYLSIDGGIICNRQNIRIMTDKIMECDYNSIWLIPGGWGTRELVADNRFLSVLKRIADESLFCLSVCTGSALLAKCGALNGKMATTNKRAFDWVVSCGNEVKWNRNARWVQDGKFYISAGVSAGIDMSLGFVRDRFGIDKAEQICERMEYTWNKTN